MKRFIPAIFAIIFFVSCKSSRDDSREFCIAYSEPIMPICVADTVSEVYLTDYLPLLAVQTDARDKQVQINKSSDIQIVTFVQAGYPKDTISLVQLPRETVVQNLISLGYDKAANAVLVGLADGTSMQDVRLFALIQNTLLPLSAIVKTDAVARIKIPKILSKRAFLRVYAERVNAKEGDSTQLFNDLLIPLEEGEAVLSAAKLTRFDRHKQIIYSLMIDRFNNGKPENDWKMHSSEVMDIVDYQGGDIVGIEKSIKSGYFDTLGVNTLWISPITQNPLDAWGKYVFKHGNKYDNSKTYTRFSGYHGYWPILSTAVDFRFGTEEELQSMLQTAHQCDKNVILDYVANHLHIHSPIYKQHPDWHTDSLLPDGRRNFELWDEARLTTWFDTHIPTLDLEREEVTQAMTDSALFWIDRFDFDGFRHDACKHIPEQYWRTLKQKIVTRLPHKKLWMIGETYGSADLINRYVKTGMLDAQFDFNVYFSALHTLCGEGSMRELNKVILESLSTYGNHHTMGNISGNHDQVRWASLAGGAISFSDDGKALGWQQNIGIGDAQTAYKRAILLHVLNLTIPGVPCIYQGDEYAEVGGNDPDNRHMMRFDEDLSETERRFKAEVSRLCKLRDSSMPLIYGDYLPVNVGEDILCFDRIYMGERVRVTINRKDLTYNVEEK